MTKSGKRVAKKRPARRKKWTTPSAEMKEQQNLLPPSPPSAASSPSSSFLPEVEGVEEGGGGEDPVIRMMNPPEISPLCTPNTEAMEKEDEDLHCLILSCSICTTEFPANEEPKVRFPGSSDEDWKDLVFRALCMHLNIQDFYEKIVSTENGINAAMMAFHMCQECLLYGWRLVELDQYLSTLKTEINSLADSFRTIISTFMSPTENDDHNGEVEVGLVFMRNFKTLATQSAPLIGTVEESNVMDDLNLNYTLDDVVDGILNEPTFANTEELQEEPVNDKDELSLNESSISNGNDTQEEELLFMNGTEGTEGHFNDDDNEDEFDRILSPSPPYSPLSPLFMEDTSVTIHDSLNMNGEDSSLGHNDFIQEEEGEGNTRSTCDVDDLFVDKMCENASPSFYPTMEDLPTPVVQPCSRRVDRNRKTRLSPKPKREPLKKIKSKRISKVGKQKKDKVTLSKRNSTPRRCAVHKNNKTKKIVNSSGAPRRLRISKKVIASLPSKDVEAYKILTRLGIPFQLVQVKVENLSLQNVLNNGIITMEDESPGD
ncbi:uncharacterized protein LOC110863674 isoform X2 [Folsomia candida]|uniref:uncharacterized protein LOC110863674 isoform X2 n=1 Tax=Folsomia candida TaxID=158441 RepID=UPI0016050DD6|nr:uncharacterized protein LOC110863674 isoform X2 [Folsomia candida]